MHSRLAHRAFFDKSWTRSSKLWSGMVEAVVYAFHKYRVPPARRSVWKGQHRTGCFVFNDWAILCTRFAEWIIINVETTCEACSWNIQYVNYFPSLFPAFPPLWLMAPMWGAVWASSLFHIPTQHPEPGQLSQSLGQDTKASSMRENIHVFRSYLPSGPSKAERVEQFSSLCGVLRFWGAQQHQTHVSVSRSLLT